MKSPPFPSSQVIYFFQVADNVEYEYGAERTDTWQTAL
jgi:hypothetical protein